MSILAQSVGLAAFLISISSMHFSRRRTILLTQLLSAGIWAIHYFLLGAYTGVVMNIINVFKAAVFRKHNSEHGQRWIPFAFGGVVLGATLLTWQGWLSLLPMVSMLFSVYGLWQKDTQRIRSVSLVSPPLWFVYNFFSGSIAGALNEVVLLASNSVALFRHRRKTHAS